jgi:hypothetical protein
LLFCLCASCCLGAAATLASWLGAWLAGGVAGWRRQSRKQGQPRVLSQGTKSVCTATHTHTQTRFERLFSRRNVSRVIIVSFFFRKSKALFSIKNIIFSPKRGRPKSRLRNGEVITSPASRPAAPSQTTRPTGQPPSHPANQQPTTHVHPNVRAQLPSSLNSTRGYIHSLNTVAVSDPNPTPFIIARSALSFAKKATAKRLKE